MKHILLIEPNTIFTQIYKQALKKAGYSVTAVDNAQDAIFAADKKIPDCVILELQIPVHNGVEFLYEFRSYPEWQSIPVIINSLIPHSEFIDSTISWNDLSLGTYLYKPRTSLEKLIKAVNEQISDSVRQRA